MAGVEQVAGEAARGSFDRRNTDWYIDRLVQGVVFLGGISAILFIIGIFVFITKEGLGFIFDTLDLKEFFTSEYWEPSDEDEPESGILALIAGTASVTGSLPARRASFSRSWWSCWPRSRPSSGDSSGYPS